MLFPACLQFTSLFERKSQTFTSASQSSAQIFILCSTRFFCAEATNTSVSVVLHFSLSANASRIEKILSTPMLTPTHGTLRPFVSNIPVVQVNQQINKHNWVGHLHRYVQRCRFLQQTCFYRRDRRSGLRQRHCRLPPAPPSRRLPSASGQNLSTHTGASYRRNKVVAFLSPTFKRELLHVTAALSLFVQNTTTMKRENTLQYGLVDNACVVVETSSQTQVEQHLSLQHIVHRPLTKNNAPCQEQKQQTNFKFLSNRTEAMCSRSQTLHTTRA